MTTIEPWTEPAMEISAHNSLRRAHHLLTVAHMAAESATKESDGDPSGMIAALATMIDIIGDEVDDAMILIAHEKKATQAEAA